MKTRHSSVLVDASTIRYNQPAECPHCGVMVHPSVVPKDCTNNLIVLFYTCSNPGCQKMYWEIFRQVRDAVPVKMEHIYLYPRSAPPQITHRINALSPEFVKRYLQAHASESAGDLELAASGYRNALEVLVKDYAKAYKGASDDKALHKLNLDNCLRLYLDDIEDAVTAFVVKEFGNNSTHYPPLEDDPFSYEDAKTCLELFLSRMDNKLMLLEHQAHLPDRYVQKFGSPDSLNPAQCEDDQQQG